MSASGVAVAPFALASRQTRGSRSGSAGPRRLPGLGLWLDANNVDGANNSTLNDGDAVAQWTDLSGAGRHAVQATPGFRPLFRAALGPTGGPCLTFDGVDDVLRTAAFSKSVDSTLFLVVRRATTTNDQRVLYWRNVSGVWLTTFNPPINLAALARNADATFPQSSIVTDPTVWHAHGGIFASGSPPSVDVDGAVVTQGGNYVFDAADPNSPISIGYPGSGAPFSGNVAAVLVYLRALTSSERQLIDTYLRRRFGTP